MHMRTTYARRYFRTAGRQTLDQQIWTKVTCRKKMSRLMFTVEFELQDALKRFIGKENHPKSSDDSGIDFA